VTEDKTTAASTPKKKKKIAKPAAKTQAAKTDADKTEAAKTDADKTEAKAQEAAEAEAAKKLAEAKKKARKEAHKRRKLQKALRLDDKMFRRVLEGLDTAVAFHDLIKDGDGNLVDYQIREVNPAFEDLVELSTDEAVGKKASEIYGRRGAPFVNRIKEALDAEEVRSFDGSLRSTKAKLRFSVVPMGGKLFALMIDDVSDAMRADSRARARRTFLENKVKALGEEGKGTQAKLTDAKLQISALQKQVRDLTGERDALGRDLKAARAVISKSHGMFEKAVDQLTKGLPES